MIYLAIGVVITSHALPPVSLVQTLETIPGGPARDTVAMAGISVKLAHIFVPWGSRAHGQRINTPRISADPHMGSLLSRHSPLSFLLPVRPRIFTVALAIILLIRAFIVVTCGPLECA
jgi:hypothetical protein